MSETTERAPRFALDETRAAAWIAAAIDAGENGVPASAALGTVPDLIDASYSQVTDDESGSATSGLVSAALTAGVITDAQAADWPELSFCFEPYDGTSAGYRWELDLGDGAGIRASSGFREMRDLGQAGAAPVGAALAIAVLSEAVAAGNEIAAGLGRYVAALPLALRAPEVTDLLARVKAAGWNGADVVQILCEWFPEVGYPDDDEPVTSN